MDNYNNTNQQSQNIYKEQTTVQTTGNKPKTLHVAHRRSPSELTTLMLEQLNLQRQLEIVQAQQQQILQQQQQQQQFNQQTNQNTYNYQNTLQPPANLSSGNRTSHHRRSSSSNSFQQDQDNQNYSSNYRNHRRSQSSITSVGSIPFSKTDPRPQALGHTRRHSLGLAEAKKAAAEAHAQRYNSPSKLSVSSSAQIVENEEHSQPILNPPVFKFPGSPKLTESPDSFSKPESRFHSRNNSNYSDRSPQRTFQFPPKDPSQSLQPPQPAFAERYQTTSGLGHKNTGSDLSSNWRKSQQTLSPPPNPSISSSFESPNFLPGHRPRNSYGGSISSISQFNQGQRKSLFAPYLPQSALPELINEGKLVTGILRVNKKNRSDAYVSTDGLLDADIFICGSKDRNRALEGDLVAVELLVVDEVWTSKREKEEKKRRKDTKSNADLHDDVHNDASTSSTVTHAQSNTSILGTNSINLNRKNSLKQRPIQKKNDDVEVEGQSLLLVEEEEINDEAKPLYAGHVVAVIDRIPGQLFSGTLGLLRPSQAVKKDKDDNNNNNNNNLNNNYNDRPKPKIVWFKPIDKKVPLIAIPTEQAPKDFVENHEKYSNQTFIASIKRWPITSLHPFGTLVSRLGPTDDKAVEVESILRDNNFMCDEYIDGQEKYMLDFPTTDYILSKNQRKEYNDDYIIACSQNGLFSDHAFHVKGIENNKIELGVHIIDVSEYVLTDSNLDKRVKKRSHGVFLPQKSVNLFPDNINHLISFNEDTKSPSLSVIFEIDSLTFEIENVWMGETAVRPTTRVDYEDIDKILNKLDGSPFSENDTAITSYFASLSLIASRLKKKRLNNPNLNSTIMLPLLDQLDDERVKLSLDIYDNIRSTSILDEIFHTVNAAVAQKIHSALGDRAFLRKFPIPTLNKFEYYQNKIGELGVVLDTSSAGSFQNSVLSIEDPIKREAVETILVKCMGRGKYVIAGKTDQELGHYLFNLPTYTHFNAPLRRYADIIVHRQLKSIINHSIDKYTEDVDSLKVVSDYCNFKKDCADMTQEQAIHLLLCQTINDMSSKTGHVLCTGVILQVYESAFDVYLPEFGIEKRVHGDQLPLNKAEFDKSNKILKLFWDANVDSSTYVPADENEPLSYRSSIKNKFRVSAADAAKIQDDSVNSSSGLLSEEMTKKLNKLKLKPPKVNILLPKENETSLAPYLESLHTSIEGNNHIQEIRLLDRVPILLRAEIGMSLPCLTVRALNPFFDGDSKK
jgi:protein SSD1